MKHSNFNAIYNGLNSTAKKVYDSVPLAEPWALHKIGSELGRKGITIQHSAIKGALHALSECGLIKAEMLHDRFQRIAVRAKPGPQPKSLIQEQSMQAAHQNKPVLVVTTSPRSPNELLSDLAIKIRNLANEVESVALIVAGQIENNDNDTKQLKQLRELLKAIN